MQLCQDLLRIFKASGLFFHVVNRIQLDVVVCCLLSQYIQELVVRRVRADCVDDWKRKFTFRQVFAKSLIFCVLLRNTLVPERQM